MILYVNRWYHIFCLTSLFVGFTACASEGDTKTYCGLSLMPYEKLPYLKSQDRATLHTIQQRKKYVESLSLSLFKSPFFSADKVIKFEFGDIYYQNDTLGHQGLMVRPKGAQVLVKNDCRSYCVELGYGAVEGGCGTIDKLMQWIQAPFNTLVCLRIPNSVSASAEMIHDIVESIKRNNQIKQSDKHVEDYQKIKHAEDEVLPRICRAICVLNLGVKGAYSGCDQEILKLATGLGWYKAYLEKAYEQKHPGKTIAQALLSEDIVELVPKKFDVSKKPVESKSNDKATNPKQESSPVKTGFGLRSIILPAAFVTILGFVLWLRMQ